MRAKIIGWGILALILLTGTLALSWPNLSYRKSPSLPVGGRPDNKCSQNYPEKYYLDKNNSCEINFLCDRGQAPFHDDCGCGCRTATTSVPIKFDCLTSDRQTATCAQNHRPVCGWFDNSIQCIKYPCAKVYLNACEACQEEKVAAWSEGECPR